jgi:hypothetical protein
MRIRSKTVMDSDKRGHDQRQSGNAVERIEQKTAEDIYRAKRQRRTNGVRTGQKTSKIKEGKGQEGTETKERQRERR